MRTPVVLFILAFACCLGAQTTRVWEQNDYEEFDKGRLERLSLRSDGKLTLAPRFRGVSDPGLSYVWALAEDSRGNVYLGGGSPAKVLRVGRAAAGGADVAGDTKADVVFEAKELEIHALAVDDDDHVYAATSPDPKIYKITRDGKSSVFFEPKAKYVWALAFDGRGNLLVATGDKGELYRVDRQGQGQVLFNSQETHVRSLAVDKAGNIILGTDPGGLILRVSPAGEGFVVYQAAKKEVTAVEVGPDGSIYAAAVGDKLPRPAAPGAPPPAVTPIPMPQPPIPGVTLPPPPPVAGGTEVYRVFPDGSPRRLWASKDDVVYALAFRDSGRLLLGTGNKGKVFQLEPGGLYTSLVKAQSSQVTAFLRRRNGAVYVAASNIGRLMEIGAESEAEGWFESEVFDARHFARWGRVSWRSEAPAGAGVALYTRSGNVDNPDRNWSPWSSAYRAPGARSESPGARFIQWKAVLTAADGRTPWLDLVEIAYLPKNLPPVVDEVEATQPGYRFQTSTLAPAAPAPSISLPPLGQPKAGQPPMPTPRFEPPTQMFPQKGAQGVRWAAHDDNDDTLLYSLYIRGKQERQWKLLKEKLTDKFCSWDATTLPDGVYYAKVVASDAPSNPEQDSLTDERESGPFEVDNTPPQITGLKAVREGGKLRITLRAADAMSPLKKAEYSVNGSEWRLLLPVGQLSDSLEEEYDFTAPDKAEGEQTVAVRIWDRVENVAIEKIVVR